MLRPRHNEVIFHDAENIVLRYANATCAKVPRDPAYLAVEAPSLSAGLTYYGFYLETQDEAVPGMHEGSFTYGYYFVPGLHDSMAVGVNLGCSDTISGTFATPDKSIEGSFSCDLQTDR